MHPSIHTFVLDYSLNNCQMKLILITCADPEGDRGSRLPPPPLKNHKKYRDSYQYWSRSLEKSRSYQASIQCGVIIGLAKRHCNVPPPKRWRSDGPVFSGICLDPLSPLKNKNERCQSWIPYSTVPVCYIPRYNTTLDITFMHFLGICN